MLDLWSEVFLDLGGDEDEYRGRTAPDWRYMLLGAKGRFMPDHRQIYLDDVIFRTNMLLDRGLSASFDEVHTAIEAGRIIEWLDEQGADMSVLLTESMADEKALVVEALKLASRSRKGEERRKLGVQHNGLCLVIALASEAKAVSPPVTTPYLPDSGIQ